MAIRGEGKAKVYTLNIEVYILDRTTITAFRDLIIKRAKNRRIVVINTKA